MAIPVIDPQISIPEPTVGVPYYFKMFASNTPTSWSAAQLPTGFAIDGTTGEITGTATSEGIANFSVVATNGDGDSTPLRVTWPILPSDTPVDPLNPALLGMNVIIDVATGTVGFPAGPVPLIVEGDDVLLYIQFQKAGKFVDLGTLTGVEIAIKEFEYDDPVVIGNTFNKTGTGEFATYVLWVKADPEILADVFTAYESSKQTKFTGVGQIRITAPNGSGAGPSSVIRSTRLFAIDLLRNVAE